MSAYVVFTRTKTIDQKELEKYWAGIRATFKGHPIEVLVAYGKHEVLEGDPIEGIVIAKFPNVKAAKDWYYSEAYQSVAKHRKHGAIYHGLIVEGVSYRAHLRYNRYGYRQSHRTTSSLGGRGGVARLRSVRP
jgi:uncharacterized protein (DUF1330 family)